MYAALRYIQVKDVETIVGMGQLELLDMYKHAGFESLQRRVRSGNVTLVKDVTGVSHHSFTRFFFPKLLPIFYPFFINLFDFGTPAWAYLVSSLIQALFVSRD